jgi:hypothetical protein
MNTGLLNIDAICYNQINKKSKQTLTTVKKEINMSTKQPSEKQLAARKAFGEAARARAAEKRGAQAVPSTETPVMPEPEAEATISQQDYIDLLKQINELKEMNWQRQVEDTRVQLRGGKLIGTVERYNLSPEHYPNPTERLAAEPRLARFAFDENYILQFDVGVTEYTTIDNVRTKEPKFTLVLAAFMYDDETGLQQHEADGSPSAYVVRRLIMHEDPEAALVIARDNNLEVDEEDETAFLNEMRYIRMRDFLLECYYPTKPKDVNRKKEIVVGGKIVETFQVTTEGDESVKIDYDQIKNKKL